MNKSLLIVIASFVSLNCLAQKHPTRLYGTVEIGSDISMKTTEVTLNEWIVFIINNDFDNSLFPDGECLSASAKSLFGDLKKGENFEYFQILKNSGIAKVNFGEKRFVITRNFKEIVDADTSYFSPEIPVTGVTFKQANKYCKWKEDLINASPHVKIRILLPSIETYLSVITNKDSINEKNCYQYNCITAKGDCGKKLKDIKRQGYDLVRADAYWPTDLGLYNLQGNAAEMTSTEGIAMGGSFKDFARQSYNNQKQIYSKAEDWLGFRYVVTLQ